MAKRRTGRVTVYLDVHVAPEVKDLLVGAGYRAIRVQESPFRGQDEHEFIGALRSEGAIFMTSDYEFVQDVQEREIRHGGIWYVSAGFTRSERELAAAIICGFSQGVNPRLMRDTVVYFAHDGLRVMGFRGMNELVYSFPEIERDVESVPESPPGDG